MTALASKAVRAGVAGEFLRYLVCSALALGSDAGLYAIGIHAGMSYALAACLSFLVGLAVAYGLSVRWAFKVRAIDNPRAEFLVFAGVGIAGLLLTEALLWLQIAHLGFSPLWAKIGAAGVVFLFNFAARKALLFTRGANAAQSLA
jgi:putative flippase GtrA